MNALAGVADPPMNAKKRDRLLRPAEEAAISWSIRLSSENATEEDRLAFEAWLARSPESEQAWRQLFASMTPFEVAARRQTRRGGLAALTLRHSASRRTALRSLIGLGLAGAASASIANRFVPLRDLTADHVTRTGQVSKVDLADGSSLVLGPRTGLNLGRDGAVRTVSLIEGEVLLDAMREPLLIQMSDMMLSAARGSFVGRRRDGISIVSAVDAPGIVTINGETLTLKAEQAITFDGTRTSIRAVSARSQTGWTEGKLFAQDEKLRDVVNVLRAYFTGIIRVDPAVAGLSLTGVLQLDDLDLAFATLASALDVSVRRITPFWIAIGPARG